MRALIPHSLPHFFPHQGLLDERDAQAKSLILEYEKIKKKVGRAIAENPGDVFLIDHPKVGRGGLHSEDDDTHTTTPTTPHDPDLYLDFDILYRSVW